MSETSLLAALREIETLDMDSAPCKTLVEYRDTLQARMREIAHVAIREHAEAAAIERSRPPVCCKTCNDWGYVGSNHENTEECPDCGKRDVEADPVAWTTRAELARAKRDRINHCDATVSVQAYAGNWAADQIPLFATRAPDSAQGQAVAWLNVCDGLFTQTPSNHNPDWRPLYTAPPSAPEPVDEISERKAAEAAWRSQFSSLQYVLNQGHPISVDAYVTGWIAAKRAPLPSAGRPVTPCTREEAVEIAKRAEVITPDIENAAVQGSKHFWVVRVSELMRLIDAARGVKSDG